LEIGNWKWEMSFGLFMLSMLTTAPAELAKRKPFRSRFLVLGSDVVATLAVTALKHNVIPRHNSSFSFPIADCQFPNALSD
jgi:hypothetical protein